MKTSKMTKRVSLEMLLPTDHLNPGLLKTVPLGCVLVGCFEHTKNKTRLVAYNKHGSRSEEVRSPALPGQAVDAEHRSRS